MRDVPTDTGPSRTEGCACDILITLITAREKLIGTSSLHLGLRLLIGWFFFLFAGLLKLQVVPLSFKTMNEHIWDTCSTHILVISMVESSPDQDEAGASILLTGGFLYSV